MFSPTGKFHGLSRAANLKQEAVFDTNSRAKVESASKRIFVTVTTRSWDFDKAVAYFVVSLKNFYQLNRFHDVERESSYEY